ncbi:uncharacterized protein LY79DRAFT_528567 [Colletotrichum navitas]|uniref:Uncharacterized protein n=1 Tax=Colletotrichum navitas TaxID=681940 RepID=A0AAD8UXS4_9PEZI|nr:uncharacterized protein LY79DRAFT_528567 [Colletotrichum navitas]KAK1569491.1 hypothetical protein LY79DRAFT_528567 [Colletotrichum navitas]
MAPTPPPRPLHEAPLDPVCPKTPTNANFSRKLPSRGSPSPHNPYGHSKTPSRSEALHSQPVLPFYPTQTPEPSTYDSHYDHSRTSSRSEALHSQPVQSIQPIQPSQTLAPAADIHPDSMLPMTRRVSPIVLPNLHSKFSTRVKRDPKKRLSSHPI